MTNTINTAVGDLVGIDFTRVDSSGSAGFGVLQRAIANNGDEYVYVQSSASTFAAGQGVAIKPNGGCALLTNTNAKTCALVAWITQAVTTRQYTWAKLSGVTVQVRVKNSCLPNVALYTSATPGALDDGVGAGTSLTYMFGVALQVGETATSSNASYNATVDKGGAGVSRKNTAVT